MLTPRWLWYARYNVLADSAQPEQVATESWTLKEDKTFLFGVGHMHTGAINVSVFINHQFVCASYPIYGTSPNVVGDEKGHIVEVSRCLDDGSAGHYPGYPAGSYRNHSLSVKKGDVLTVEGWYYVGRSDPRILPSPAGAHLGVMSYAYFVFATDPERQW